MSNYLLSIEDEYAKLRGMPSRLTPMDWSLADSWEQKGVPLHIVVRAMGDVAKKFGETKRPDTINSLKYFKQAVEKEFAEWQTSQIGKQSENNFTEENNMSPLSFATITTGVDETVEILETLVAGYAKTNLPEPIKSAAAVTRGELLALMDETKQKHLSMSDIETRLEKLAENQNLSLALSISEEESKEMTDEINREFQYRTISHDARAKMLTRKLYQKFNLPELTLFEI